MDAVVFLVPRAGVLMLVVVLVLLLLVLLGVLLLLLPTALKSLKPNTQRTIPHPHPGKPKPNGRLEGPGVFFPTAFSFLMPGAARMVRAGSYQAP